MYIKLIMQHILFIFLTHSSLKIMWIPESVSTGYDISPTYKAKEAASKAYYISPGPKDPKSPLLPADLHSLNYFAKFENS